MVKRLAIFTVLLSLISFSSGCDFLLKIFQREMVEEKELFGEIYGYNPKVRELQGLLKEVGYSPGSSDGKLGIRTRSVIREFQKDYELNQTGYVDKETWKELNKIYQARLDFFKKVNKRKVQTALKKAGFDPGPIDGKIGLKTKKAIKEFQGLEGLVQNGELDFKTWNILQEYLEEKE